VTPDPKVWVRVVAIDAAAGSAALRIWDLPEGCLRKEDSKPRVYLIENGAKRWVTSPAVLQALGKTWADVRSVPDGALVGVPDGPDIDILTVSVVPFPVPLNRQVTVTVSAVNSSGAAVTGDVLVDRSVAGATGTPFTRTFRTRRVRVPGPPPPEWEIVFPEVTVRAAGFPDTPVDCGWE
jgi:hypothetical protein